MAGRVKAQRQPLEARSWVARGGQTRRDLAAAQPGSAGAGWERELTGGAHASVMGEREDVEDGRHETKRKHILRNTRKACAGQAGQRRERWPVR
jgi:hypothetical protein